MNRAQIIKAVMQAVGHPELASKFREELIPAFRQLSPGRLANLTKVDKMENIPEHWLSGTKAGHINFKDTGESWIGLGSAGDMRQPGPIQRRLQLTPKDVLHESVHEIFQNQIKKAGPEIKKFSKDLKELPYNQRYSYTQNLDAPNYYASNPSEFLTEMFAKKLLDKEALKGLPKKVKEPLESFFNKYKAVPIAVGGAAAAGATLAPEESEAAMSLKEPIKLAKAAQKTLSKDWDLSSTAKALVGKVWNGREIQAVYKPRASKPSPFKPGHPDYKPSTSSDKRAVVFSDGSYNMLDTDDLRTVVSALGSDEYMGKLTPQLRETGMKEKAMQSLRMKNWMNIGHDTLEEAEKTRKKYARDWVDLFGGQGIGIETIEYMGKYRNMSAPYVDVLREVTPKIISNLEASVKEFKKALKPVPKAILEKLDELKSIKFLKNQSTYLSKYGFRGRDWTTPEGWEDI
jgi:hypothetical protein